MPGLISDMVAAFEPQPVAEPPLLQSGLDTAGLAKSLGWLFHAFFSMRPYLRPLDVLFGPRSY